MPSLIEPVVPAGRMSGTAQPLLTEPPTSAPARSARTGGEPTGTEPADGEPNGSAPLTSKPAGGEPARGAPTMRGELLLRPWRDADAPALARAYRDPAIRRWHARSMSEDEARDWIRQRAERWAAETGADWAVTAGGTLVGRAGLRTVDLAEGRAEMAYWTLPAARGNGLAGRALGRLTRWCTDELGLHRLELLHAIENPASCRVAGKSGYRYEGTLRQAVPHADGFHDMHLHAHLATDPT
ncbi:GNAT family N-acetyltransferase [Actinocatenispora comari]|uniref:Acetyltransferase n=1 Tax=Actinocatenispora comari TaxID=2807577 RepID=A0A8J4EL64_9ACTN|nr:GNAT family N-acetyltransferase [Actinocatenispora comari]GIL25269.1 acetyltransferase [Actinocatenispora comari]